jgi:hypothetical protein
MLSVAKRERFGWSVMVRSACPLFTGLIPLEFKVMPAKTLLCPVVTVLSAVPRHS